MIFSLSDATLVGVWLSFLVIFSYFTTGIVRIYSLRCSLIDEPNERSSHKVSTPRGGGLSISISLLVSIVFLSVIEWIPINIAIAMVGGGLLVSVVGWMDDHNDIASLWRGIMYLTAAIWALYFIGGLDEIKIGEFKIHLGLSGNILAILIIAWLTNLYNFMDGTDGLASIQAITTGLMAGLLLWFSNQHGLAAICFVVAASSSGFLVWNWPPAKIFMGDVSSCLIGFTFGVLAIIGENIDTVNINIWLILLAVFVWDATFTLIKRIINGEKWYSAHCSHAYQKLTQLGLSHSKLAISLLVLNIVILWPLAYTAHRQDHLSFFIVILSVILIFVIWLIIQLYYSKRIMVEGDKH